MIVDGTRPTDIAWLRSIAKENFQNGAYPISGKLYRWDNGRISVFTE